MMLGLTIGMGVGLIVGITGASVVKGIGGVLVVKLLGVMVEGELKRALTGVRSLLSSSVAEAAASMRSCHRLSYSAAAD